MLKEKENVYRPSTANAHQVSEGFHFLTRKLQLDALFSRGPLVHNQSTERHRIRKSAVIKKTRDALRRCSPLNKNLQRNASAATAGLISDRLGWNCGPKHVEAKPTGGRFTVCAYVCVCAKGSASWLAAVPSLSSSSCRKTCSSSLMDRRKQAAVKCWAAAGADPDPSLPQHCARYQPGTADGVQQLPLPCVRC